VQVNGTNIFSVWLTTVRWVLAQYKDTEISTVDGDLLLSVRDLHYRLERR